MSFRGLTHEERDQLESTALPPEEELTAAGPSKEAALELIAAGRGKRVDLGEVPEGIAWHLAITDQGRRALALPPDAMNCRGDDAA